MTEAMTFSKSLGNSQKARCPMRFLHLVEGAALPFLKSVDDEFRFPDSGFAQKFQLAGGIANRRDRKVGDIKVEFTPRNVSRIRSSPAMPGNR